MARYPSGTKKCSLVVGIDFGMTTTGVAFANGETGFNRTELLRGWPGDENLTGVDLKVPSLVGYSKADMAEKLFGFSCLHAEEYDVRGLWKLYLDPDYCDRTGAQLKPLTYDGLHRDYLQLLYKSIMSLLEHRLLTLQDKPIEFVFSIPVVWMENELILSKIKQLVKDAGFEDRPIDSADLTLTEAQSAAIFATEEVKNTLGHLAVGDNFILCDLGGATADINVFEVVSLATRKLQLLPKWRSEGHIIGSHLINEEAKALVTNALIEKGLVRDDAADTVAGELLHERFEIFKTTLGGDKERGLLRLKVPYEARRPDTQTSTLKEEDYQVLLTRETLTKLFDKPIRDMCQAIDALRNNFQSSTPHHPSIPFLILTGGFANSPYVRNALQARYQRIDEPVFDAIIVPDTPHLAVTYGLVMARSQTLQGGPYSFPTGQLNLSYGVLVARQDGKKAQGEESEYIWLLRKGETQELGRDKRRQFRIRPRLGQAGLFQKNQETQKGGHEDRQELSLYIKLAIVKSREPLNRLPRWYPSEADQAKRIGELEFELKGQEIKKTLTRQEWKISRQLPETWCEVRVLIGNDLSFQVHVGGENRTTVGLDEKLHWNEPTAPLLPEDGRTRYNAEDA